MKRKAQKKKYGWLTRLKNKKDAVKRKGSAIQKEGSAMRHKSQIAVHKTRQKFTKEGGVYSWKRLKIALLIGLALFVAMTIFIGNITIPLMSEVQYWFTIGTPKAGGGQFWDYGGPQNFFKIMRPLDPASGSVSGPDFYLFNPIGLIMGYLLLVLFTYVILTIFSDFNFGKKNKRRATIAMIVCLMLIAIPLASAAWQTIFEQNGNTGGYYMTGAGWYHKQTFTLDSPLTSNRVKYEILLSKTGTSFAGTYTYKIVFPGGSSYEIINYVSLLQSSQHWESVITSDAQTCPAGTGYIQFGITQAQPSQSFIYTYDAIGNPYSGGVFIYNHGSGEVTMSTTDMTARAYREYTPTQVTLTMAVSGSGSTTPSVGTHQYDQGTTVKCTATASSGWHFSQWSGAYSGTSNPYDLVMNTAKSMTAVFHQNDPPPTYPLTMAMGTGGDHTSPSVGQHTGYHSGDTQAIQAYAATGYQFTSWTGTGTNSYSGTDNPHTITFDSTAITETANFAQTTRTLTMSTTAGGTTDPTPGAHTYAEGAKVICTATPNTGYMFSAWDGAYTGNQNPVTITMNGDKSLMANFAPVIQYSLTMNTEGPGSTNPSGTTMHDGGEQVQCTATPDDSTHYHFTQWTGSYTGTENPHTIQMTGDKTMTAHFVSNVYILTITTDGQGSVSKYPNPPYTYNEAVELTANPSSGWSFDHWSGDISGSDYSATIYMTSNKAVAAHFTQDALPPVINLFTTNISSLKAPGNVTFAWTTSGSTAVHLFLNDVDQGEFDTSITAKSVRIQSTTTAKIEATGVGGTTGSTVITITVGEGPIGGGGFNYNWLLLIIIPVSLILFDRWLKKKPPFGKKEGDGYYTINIGEGKVSAKKKAAGKKKTAASDKARDTAKKVIGGISSKIKSLLKRNPPSSGPGDGNEGYVE
jgi:hypothetical protein